MSHSRREATRVGALRAEHHREPFGIGEARPRLSWQVFDTPVGWRQAGYEIECTDLDAEQVSTIGRIDSGESLLVPWPHADLDSRDRVRVRVRVWNSSSAEPTCWSPPLDLEAGLLGSSEWRAQFVTPDAVPGEHAAIEHVPLLRREFTARGEVRRARLYATALGHYELELNGKRIGDHALAPGWTSYQHRLRYQTFDVTDALRPGTNALGAWLADGWYRGRLGFHGGKRNIYGDRRALLAQLEIHYADGSTDTISTDQAWRTSPGPILFSGIYDGERYDARRELPGWSSPDFDDRAWTAVEPVDHDLDTLFAPLGPPIRCTQEVKPVGMTTTPSGARVVDFGQNLVGRVLIHVRGRSGEVIRIRHAEVLQDGELCVRPLREAKATDEYVLRGAAEGETWEPRFTFHGFRYAEVTGQVELVDVTARVYHTDMARTGTFSCSDPLVQQLHDNVVWSMRGNFLDVPTDCPQRDERLGWTGDIQVFAPTASFLYDCAGMLASWLRDLAAEQLPDGTVPCFVPVVPTPVWGPPTFPAAVWGDVATLTPWDLYQRFGDPAILEAQYSSSRAWVDRMTAAAGDDHLWDSGEQLGDWLDPTAPPENPTIAKADPYLVATAYYARSTAVLADMARVLGHTADQDHYEQLARKIAAAFTERWVLPSGLLDNEAQTSYALALRFGLFPTEGQRLAAGRRLAELVREADFHIATGFVGTPLICDALTETGHHDTAYSLLLNQGCPSWLYPVTRGATTIWERWDSLLPDGTVNPGSMTSFNHYAFGAVADWLHRTVAGLAPAEPGYRRLLVRPLPGGGLTHADATHETPYGRAEVAWDLDGDTFTLRLTVPSAVTATVYLPGHEDATTVSAGRHEWKVALPAA
ncbi:family 78 glycoside hydrolase catalytic domain [Streptomyces sp. NPDC004752]